MYFVPASIDCGDGLARPSVRRDENDADGEYACLVFHAEQGQVGISSAVGAWGLATPSITGPPRGKQRPILKLQHNHLDRLAAFENRAIVADQAGRDAQADI